MDTRMIEVAMGLVLVFALTSLLVTAMRELWASVWSSRGRHLQEALVSFVGDNKAFADTLMKHPLLLSLSKQTADKKLTTSIQPSYMGADIVITALVAQLVDRAAGGVRPASPAQFLAAVQAANPSGTAPLADLPNAIMLRGMLSLIHGVENDWSGYEARLCAWYDSVIERSVGWFKRWNQLSLLLFGVMVAAAANINPIVIAERLWQDAALRKAVADVAERAGQEFANSKTVPAGVSALPADRVATTPTRKRDTKVDETERSLEALRNDLEVTASEARKQPTTGAWQTVADAQNNLLIVRGAIDTARLPDDQSAIAGRRLAQSLNQMERGIKGLRSAIQKVDPGQSELQERFADLDAALAAEKKGLLASDAVKPAQRAACQDTLDADARALCERLDDLNRLKILGLPMGWNPPAVPTVFAEQCAATRRTRGDKAVSCTDPHFGDVLLMILGWMVTAVAASLGAPFWFDALSRLAKLRSAGGRPSDADERGVASTPPGGTTMAGPAGFQAGGSIGSAAGRSPSASPFWAGVRQPMDDALNIDEKTLASSEVSRIQRALGLRDAQVTGAFDGTTRQAIKTWQAAQGYGTTAELTALEIKELLDTQGTKGAVGFVADPVKETALAPPRSAISLYNVDIRSGPGAMWSRLAIAKTGETLQVGAVVQGDELLGNSTWLRLTGDQRYVWSGAVQVIEPTSALPPSNAAPAVKRRANKTILPLSPAEIDRIFGPIGTTDTTPRGAVLITTPAGWAAANLKPLAHPLLDRISKGSFTVHVRALPYFVAALNAIDTAGFGDLILTCGGTFVPRHINWNPDKPLSSHTWGVAIDLNPQWNAYGQQPAMTGQKGCLRELVPFFAAQGFAWGGDFTSGADGMHFELARTDV